MKEIYVDAFGFEERYEVSNLGKVRSKPRIKIRKNGRKLTVKGKMLSFQENEDGYYMVELHKNDGKNCPQLVHKLVWESFNGKIPTANPKLEVCHKDGNNKNNSLCNLYLDTHKNNCNHPLTRKRQSDRMKGNTISKGIISKFRKPIVATDLDGMFVKKYECITDCEKDGFCASNVSKCCRNEYLRENNNIYKDHKWYLETDYKKMLGEINS